MKGTTIIGNDFDKSLSMAIKFKKDFKTKKSGLCSEIFMSNSEQRILFTKNKEFMSGLFLFKMVRKDVEDYIEKNGAIIPIDEIPVNYKNENFDSKNKIIGVDLNHAYWRVAYLKGYISQNTYEKGLKSSKLKQVRLSALSNMGRSKIYKVYAKGEFSHEEKSEPIKELIDIYNDIRYSTFAVLKDISIELGNDFYCWKTDCVYFKNIKRNILLVTNILDSHDLLWKIEEL